MIDLPDRTWPLETWASSRRSNAAFLVAFKAPAKVWSTNQRVHWSVRARLTESWRSAARDAGRYLGQPPPGRWLVRVELQFPRRSAKRDPHNFTGTVCKAVIDGLTDAGYWPDDTSEWVITADPYLAGGARRPLLAGVHGWRVRTSSD
jgi:hypothetical protein